MSFNNTEKVDVRRHLGYPVAGNVGPNAFVGYRFFQAYGVLEYRLEHLAAEEETVVRDYITKLNQLEVDLYGTSGTLGTKVAAVWERNPIELAERQALYDNFKSRLSEFFGVPIYRPKYSGSRIIV